MATLVLCLLLSAHLQGLSEPLQDPSEPLQDPSEHLQDPSEHLQESACPSEHLQESACPSEHLQDPSEHLQDPSEHLQDPSEHLQESDSLLSRTMAQLFIVQHTYGGINPVNCSRFMNLMLQALKANECKPINTIVLGQTHEFTDLPAVDKVCKTKPVNGEHTSRDPFRVVVCKSNNREATPPNCTYEQHHINGCHIVLGCERDRPTHFDRCR